MRNWKNKEFTCVNDWFSSEHNAEIGLYGQTLINDFTPIEIRPDIGHLWENFIISERIKRNHYHRAHLISFFWRTYTGAELDYVEQGMGKLSGHEIKWGKKIVKAPKSWIENYPEADSGIINPGNFQDFVI